MLHIPRGDRIKQQVRGLIGTAVRFAFRQHRRRNRRPCIESRERRPSLQDLARAHAKRFNVK